MPNQRTERRRPSPTIDITALLTQSAARLMAGDALSAQRIVRTAEQLMLLQARLKRRAQTEASEHDRREHALQARQRELDARHVALNQRDFDIACETERLNELKQSLEALYAQMYNTEPPPMLP